MVADLTSLAMADESDSDDIADMGDAGSTTDEDLGIGDLGSVSSDASRGQGESASTEDDEEMGEEEGGTPRHSQWSTTRCLGPASPSYNAHDSCYSYTCVAPCFWLASLCVSRLSFEASRLSFEASRL